MTKLQPYLTFNGQCEAAFAFYEECLGGKTLMMVKFADSPMADQAPPDWGDKVLHATFGFSGQTFGGADLPPGEYKTPQGFSATLNLESAAEADRLFDRLSEEGTVRLPIQATFWAQRFGMLTDQFGTPWMINGGTPD